MNTRRDIRAPEYREADELVHGPSAMPEVRARQGVSGHNARYVLGFGIAAVIIAFFIVYVFYFT